MKKLITCFLVFFPFLIFGQNISGVVLDKMGVPVQFAYVICKSNNKIVYSDENGCFKIEGGKVVFYDTIEVISVGFKKFQLPINSDNSFKEYCIVLEQETYTLSPLIISSSKKLKSIKIGVFYKKANRYFIMNPGQEIAVLFHSDTFPSILKSVSFLLNNFSNKNFSHARINVYEFDTITQKPGKILNNSSFFVKNKVLNKLVELDLSTNNIVITNPYFCVGVEFVKNESKGIIEKGNVLEPHHLTLGSIKPQLSKHFIREITKDNSFNWSDFNRENLIIGLELKF